MFASKGYWKLLMRELTLMLLRECESLYLVRCVLHPVGELTLMLLRGKTSTLLASDSLSLPLVRFVLLHLVGARTPRTQDESVVRASSSSSLGARTTHSARTDARHAGRHAVKHKVRGAFDTHNCWKSNAAERGEESARKIEEQNRSP